MKKITLFISLFILFSATFSFVSAKEFNYRNPKYLQCDKNIRPFTIIYPPEFIEDESYGEGHGTFVFSGKIVKEEGPLPFSDTGTVDYIRMKAKNDGSLAYRYFLMMAKGGNTINLRRDKDLYFAIGTLENGELKSTAIIKPRAKKRIFQSLENGQTISLKITVPFYEGMGAPAHFTFACKIG